MVECALCSKSKKGAHLQKNCKKTERKGNVKNVVPQKTFRSVVFHQFHTGTLQTRACKICMYVK